MVRAVRAPIQRMRAATEIPARQTIARAVRALRCALAESNNFNVLIPYRISKSGRIPYLEYNSPRTSIPTSLDLGSKATPKENRLHRNSRRAFIITYLFPHRVQLHFIIDHVRR
jgi:hypothetical protein